MRSLRVPLVLASMLALSPSTLAAQAARLSCKDGSLPKIGHFTCWGHGGVVTSEAKPAARSTTAKAKSTGNAVKQQGTAAKAKKKVAAKKGTAKKAHATKAKAKKKSAKTLSHKTG